MVKLPNEIIKSFETIHGLGFFQGMINKVLKMELDKANNVKGIALLEALTGEDYPIVCKIADICLIGRSN